MPFQKYVFSCHRQHIDRYTSPALMRFRLYTKRFENNVHATNTRGCNIFGHRFHFDAFSTVFGHSTLIRQAMRFRLIHFQELFQIDAFPMKTRSAY